MAREFSAIYEQDGEWWVGRTEEVRGAFGQGHTLDEARESLREAIELILDVRREQMEAELEGREVIRESIALAGA